MSKVEFSESLLDTLKGKVIIITGGASGIGKAMVEYFHSKGAKVVFGDLNDANGKAIAEKLGEGATYTHCDVTKWDNLLDMHELAIKTYSTIDVVVPNAGVNEVEDIFEDKFDANGRLLPPKHILNEINLKGVFNIGNFVAVKLAIHFFRKLEKKGVIVMISSTAGYMGEPIPGYSAAKHGIVGIMRSLRDNLKKFNIRINIVAPYMTRTPLGDAIPGLWDDLNRRGIPVQEPLWVARSVGTLAADEKFHGHTIYSAHSEMWEIEDAITRLEPEWLGKENARIFDLSRSGPSYFPSKSGL